MLWRREKSLGPVGNGTAACHNTNRAILDSLSCEFGTQFLKERDTISNPA
jgi:hypothetical protein